MLINIKYNIKKNSYEGNNGTVATIFMGYMTGDLTEKEMCKSFTASEFTPENVLEELSSMAEEITKSINSRKPKGLWGRLKLYISR
jgi:hypothetical protein